MNGLAAAFYLIQTKEIIQTMKQVKEEGINLRNQATMIGLFSMLDDSITKIETSFEEEAKKLTEEGKEVWNQWCEKSREYAKGNETVMKILADNFED